MLHWSIDGCLLFLSLCAVLQVMLLICKEPLVALYSKAGFQVVGPSEVVHGADPWIEMSMKLSM